MTARQVDLCVAILEDHFGFYVARVGSVLLRGQIPLALLAQKLATLRISVKRSLAILSQHNLLQIEAGGRGPVYSVLAEEVCQLIRAPRAILVIKTLYDAVAEAIFEDILARGQSSCSACIRRVAKCLDNLEFNKIKIEFVRLAEAQILKRCPQLSAEESTPSNPVFQAVPDPFLMPDVILDGKESASTSRKRKRPGAEGAAPSEDSDAKILWRVNWARMDLFFRDDLMLDAIAGGGNELLDKQALRVAQLLLKIGEVKSPLYTGQSPSIQLQDVCRYVREHHLDYSRDFIDEKLSMIGKDQTGIVRRIGDSSGGIYIINYEKGIESLCFEHIESTIREKVGDKAVRIFRLLRLKGFLEEEQVEKEAMLSAKETKELCCALMDNGFITTRQAARSNDSRTILQKCINLPNLRIFKFVE